jgi:hypothetical protein
VLLDCDETEEFRKRCFQTAFDKIASAATCGCATTGSEWVFTKIRYNNMSKKSVVEISEKYNIDLGSEIKNSNKRSNLFYQLL